MPRAHFRTFIATFVATFVEHWPIRQRCRQRLRQSHCLGRPLQWARVLWICLAGPVLCGVLSGFGSEPQVLLFVETPGTSPYQTALENRGYAYASFKVESDFNQAIEGADPAYNVVVVDSAVNYHDFASVAAFAQAGLKVAYLQVSPCAGVYTFTA